MRRHLWQLCFMSVTWLPRHLLHLKPSLMVDCTAMTLMAQAAAMTIDLAADWFLFSCQLSAS